MPYADSVNITLMDDVTAAGRGSGAKTAGVTLFPQES